MVSALHHPLNATLSLYCTGEWGSHSLVHMDMAYAQEKGRFKSNMD